MKSLILTCIRFYQRFFSLPGCRFDPSCSRYTYQAIRKYGILRGSFLGLKQILNCHPYGNLESTTI